MGHLRSALAVLAGLGSLTAVVAAPPMVPLPIVYPKANFGDGPLDMPDLAPAVDDPAQPKQRPMLPLVPAGTEQLARGCPVTASSRTYVGSLVQITDGQKEAYEDTAVELKPKAQWVQIDLGASHQLWAVALWHFHLERVIYHGVVVQVSDDPTFSTGVTTLFNNDAHNRCGQGAGTDREYWETNYGRLVDAKQTTARYVRCWSAGSTYTDALNRCTEIEVWGVRAPSRSLRPLSVAYPRLNVSDQLVYGVTQQLAKLPYADRVDLPRTTPWPAPMAPAGAGLLAKGRPVTSSTAPLAGTLAQITDGLRSGNEGELIELRHGPEWVQIDLGEPREVWCVGLWLAPGRLEVVKELVVQLSDDPTFRSGVTTLFNNDYQNQLRQGPGADRFYAETTYGRLIQARGTRARYLRCWSFGSPVDGLSRWTEIEAWGL